MRNRGYQRNKSRPVALSEAWECHRQIGAVHVARYWQCELWHWGWCWTINAILTRNIRANPQTTVCAHLKVGLTRIRREAFLLPLLYNRIFMRSYPRSIFRQSVQMWYFSTEDQRHRATRGPDNWMPCECHHWNSHMFPLLLSVKADFL